MKAVPLKPAKRHKPPKPPRSKTGSSVIRINNALLAYVETRATACDITPRAWLERLIVEDQERRKAKK